MSFSLPLVLAAARAPLFGSQWLALLAILGGVAAFMALVAGAGRWLAATHPDTPRRAAVRAAPVGAETAPSPEVLVVIAAAVAATVGRQARIAAVVPVRPTHPSTEWSVEGRRQIYSSHQIR